MERWITNLIRVQEKRAFHGETVLFFALFVGTMRLLAEVLFVAYQPASVGLDLLLYVTWYWLCFFAFGLPVRYFAPPPWQSRMNVMLVGLFLGFLPPVIDALWYGWGGAAMGQRGFAYAYVVDFPEAWPWLLVAPDRRMPPGEGLILWGAVVFTAWYVRIRTASYAKALGAGLFSYGICVFLGGIMPTLTHRAVQWMNDLPGTTTIHYVFDGDMTAYLVVAQLVIAMVLYFAVYRPELLRVQWYRIVHVLPLIAVTMVGYAWVTPLDASVVLPIFAILVAGFLTVAENDHWDSLEENPEATPVVQRLDVVALSFFFWSLTGLLILVDSMLGPVLVIYGVASHLYNGPIYRGKRYFPANLKLEGLWGGCAFMLGVFAAVVLPMAQGRPPMWFDRGYSGAPFFYVVGADTVIAAALVFGGWSLLAMLKDHKDVDEDARLGTQTVFTLARRRAKDADWVLGRLRILTFICMGIGALAPMAMGRLPYAFAAVMMLLAIAIWRWPMHPPTAVFRRTLLLLTAYLVVLAFGLSLLPVKS